MQPIDSDKFLMTISHEGHRFYLTAKGKPPNAYPVLQVCKIGDDNRDIPIVELQFTEDSFLSWAEGFAVADARYNTYGQATYPIPHDDKAVLRYKKKVRKALGFSYP